MTKEIINSLLLAGMFLFLFAIAEVLLHKFKMKADDTRKIVHIATGFICLLFPVVLHNHWAVLLLCSVFAAGLFFSKKYNLLRSVNGINRVSYGSLWYPVGVYGSYLAFNYFKHDLLFFYLPVLTMAICDPVAAFVGKRWPSGKFSVGQSLKTFSGSLAFFLSSVLLTVILFYFISPVNFYKKSELLITLLIAATATAAEAVSTKGSDNITVPLSVVVILTLVHD